MKKLIIVLLVALSANFVIAQEGAKADAKKDCSKMKCCKKSCSKTETAKVETAKPAVKKS
ncbi:MAG: hypothetical protein EAZ51_06060 [Sphingobacteriales bacterium]|nr:MAG: hypothetical protein EAZ64_06955 [Sphingobacteriales bacterium]TAF80454.1 MAG: hypothetical protein EAZ51_06060 [Sphingobacteriales bacterium]